MSEGTFSHFEVIIISGIFALLLSVITADLVGLEHLGPALGFMFTASGFSASIGTPAGGKEAILLSFSAGLGGSVGCASDW